MDPHKSLQFSAEPWGIHSQFLLLQSSDQSRKVFDCLLNRHRPSSVSRSNCHPRSNFKKGIGRSGRSKSALENSTARPQSIPKVCSHIFNMPESSNMVWDTVSTVALMIDNLHDLMTSQPTHYIDLEGIELSHYGTVSLLQIHVKHSGQIYTRYP